MIINALSANRRSSKLKPSAALRVWRIMACHAALNLLILCPGALSFQVLPSD